MFNKKYFILVFFVFLIAITSVSAQDDAVASQDLNELSFNDNVVLDTNTDAEHYADGAIRQDTGQTADDLINLSECSSAVLQVSDNEGVICIRRDAANAADIYIESGSWGDIGYLKQYKTSGGYFSHAIVTSNGWLIGNGGVRLSGGQAQRIALARTLCHKKPVLVLDDPFSALDISTEKKIYNNLCDIAKNNIVIIMTHRLYMFPKMDKVIWMDNGKAIVGTHEEIMLQCPQYRKLYENVSTQMR